MLILNALNAFKKYKFLLKQLVKRDFKMKYKRSMLGMMWSLLNPLLTMLVLNTVFSTMFRMQVEHYMVYLLSGLVIYNYLSDSTNLSMFSVVGNAELIKKVYIPKYIFPISKVFSSAINFAISFIALFLIIFISGLRPTWAYLMLPFIILCTMLFAMGIGFILSVMMVFFKDTQFLYGVFLMIWMYLTPIMYPESLMPPQYTFLLNINPLYYYIHYLRSIVIDGVVPSFSLHVISLVTSVVTLIIGLYVFKKTQDKFITHL